MAIAITEEHQEMARVARAFLKGNNARAEARALLEAAEESLPEFWPQLIELGWTGIHLPEEFAGSGAGLQELVLLVEELGYALAPGPFLPTVWASSLINHVAGSEVKSELLPDFAAGKLVGAVGIGGDLQRADDGSISGRAGLVLSAGLADILLLRVGNDVVIVERDQAGLTIEKQQNIDPSRRVAKVKCEGVHVAEPRFLSGAYQEALRLGRLLASAEASGGAHACVDMAVEYAGIREQFGRTIATFQAVKHHCANMYIAAECTTAAVWDAARAEAKDRQAEFAGNVAASLAMPAFRLCSQLNTQVHGGIGYTWEHDAHLYIRRSSALSALFNPEQAKEQLCQLATEKVRRHYNVDLPAEAEAFRVEVQAFIKELKATPSDQQRKLLSSSGYLVPHWPKPWGLEAGPVQQLVIDQEFKAAGVSVPNLSISGWVTLTIAQHGTQDQLDRWIRQSLDGDIEFCQLFSEPNAGSDAAAIQSRGIKVDGGWRVNGQKVWTSRAQYCNRGFMTVRTDPKAAKHEGITMMVIDLQAEGVEVRPLRQVTGHAEFNEIFFNDVFVPDCDVVGPVNGGWKVARATLGNERVSIGGGMDFSKLFGVSPLDLMQKFAADDKGVAREVGELLAKDVAAKLLNLRSVVRAVEGVDSANEGNITKLLGAEHAITTAELACRIVGESTAVLSGAGAMPTMMLLAGRGLTIAGGTSEIVRNQIAERILKMPRDPLIK